MAEPGQARLTIDLGALAANYRRLREEARGVEVAAVVKADAYGLGIAAVAPALWDTGCRRFFVAQLGEALTLRDILGEAWIAVLNGLPHAAAPQFLAAGLVPVLNHPGELEVWSDLARARARRLPAVLQVDTGMCRLGCSEAEVARLDPERWRALDLELVMSHLACAEEPANPLNQAQAARFERLLRLLPPVPASLANSSGIFLGPAFHHQLCRPGVALYGVNPTPGQPNPMAPVVTLEAPVIQLHEVQRPGTVGYGATWTTRAESRIATVPVGYADGFPRAASSRATAWIGAHEVPVAGRVSMDLITLDVSDLPAEAVAVGTTVRLIGGPDGVDRLASAASTIGYEILTRLGRRFTRRYIPAAPGTRA